MSVFYPLRVEMGDEAFDSLRDEYDDLVLPLLDRLQRGLSLTEIVEWMEAQMRDDYGLEPGVGDRAAGVIDALQNWWAAESTRPDAGT